LDAYGGTGMLSFEALSRGAHSALILELRPRIAAEIRKNAIALGLADRIRVQVGQSPRDLRTGSWDLVLADPPYAMDPVPILAGLAPRVGRLLVLEHDGRTPLKEVPGLRLDRSRRYGDTRLSFFRPPPPDGG
jgi:16S rRNA (guanine966-N2)-methyltransferase